MKNIVIKILKYTACGVSVVCLIQACSKKLDAVVPQDTISNQLVLSDSNAAQTLYTGVYSVFRSYCSSMFYLGELRSEIWTDGLFTESVDGTAQQLYDQNLSRLNVPYSNWASFYNLLYQINNVIVTFPKTTLSTYTVNKELAEMYGLRAYVYYTLLRTWGAVPITTETVPNLSNAAQTYKVRSSRDSVMLQIKADIQKSLDLYNGDNTVVSGNRVYWNRLATLTLKGDVYIWSASVLNGGSADYTTAQNALAEVQNLTGTVSLDANYADVFDPTKKSNNKEIIFALNYELNQATQGTFGSFLVNSIQATTLTFTPSNPSVTVSSIYPYVNGANRVGMNAQMIAKLTADPTDTRINGSFKVMYGNTAPYNARGVILTKWIGSTSGTSQVYNNDYPIYRYADVLLLAAEAKAKLGQDPSNEINQIRKRAYGAGYVPYTNNSVDSNMHAILEEQLREFIGEGKRWYALRRAGDKWVYNYINPKYLSAATVSSGNGPTMEMPISLTMLNNDPLLAQTEGY
ncbi:MULTISPECIES: RagB/SusD family nutrient uptake outer membrane protein [Chitinophagaceae]